VIDAIGLDADDTLWHNEDLFHQIETEFAQLVGRYTGLDEVTAKHALAEVEHRNVTMYGYGVKSFVMSMVESAIDITDARVTASELRALIDRGKDMLRRPTELLPHVPGVIEALAQQHRLVLITKGDPVHQESKVAASGLAQHFEHVEVVNEKDTSTYRRVIERHGIDPHGFVMVGNSLKSDVLPVLEIGGIGVHIPYAYTWALERAEVAAHHHQSGRFHVLEHLGKLPLLIDQLAV
jgi:putative hydrolase of the HAD superfamily